MKKDKKRGFTLAELLIVVAIIGVLVAISIPIFSRQLEKSRDAVSVANIRSAYAEAMNYALEYNGYPVAKNPSYYTDGKNKIYVDGSGYVSAVVMPITIKSREADNWSGLAENLPFVLLGNSVTKGYEGGDDGRESLSYRYWYIEFEFKSKSEGELKDALIWHSGT